VTRVLARRALVLVLVACASGAAAYAFNRGDDASPVPAGAQTPPALDGFAPGRPFHHHDRFRDGFGRR
jgi:hypothetical protein